MDQKEEFGFKELIVWQKAVEFASHVIKKVEFKNSEKKHYRITEQIEASASSIAANIAEGKGRYSNKEFKQFLYIARGSIYETISFLNIVRELGWISKEDINDLETEGLQLNKMLNSLINKLKNV
ncbi:MAG: four helix bundle protein [Bacteroidota bacterium]|nr:four helix bundle protein [Bacteroidota bacterium]